MCLIKDNTGLLWDIFRHDISNLWVQQVMIAVDYNVGIGDLMGKGRGRGGGGEGRGGEEE